MTRRKLQLMLFLSYFLFGIGIELVHFFGYYASLITLTAGFIFGWAVAMVKYDN